MLVPTTLLAHPRSFESGCAPCSIVLRNIRLVTASACSRGTSGLKRPIISSQADPASSSFGSHLGLSCGFKESGSQASGAIPGVRPANLRVATPNNRCGNPVPADCSSDHGKRSGKCFLPVAIAQYGYGRCRRSIIRGLDHSADQRNPLRDVSK